ncbi:MAG: HxsD-like protein [Nannocystaceae bacterium]|nr:HxsD-like protein [bacterium]
MKALRFHKTLYSGEAVDAAMRQLDRFASFETDDDEAYWIVRVQAKSAKHQAALEHELGNFALGLTIERGGPVAESAGD